VEQGKHTHLDAHEIIPHLWQGSAPPTGSLLSECGFDIVVLCAEKYQPPAEEFLDVTVISSPSRDDFHRQMSRGTLKQALQTARIVSDAIHAEKQVLVTCMAGMNRSGLISALALHRLNGWSGPKCIRWVRTKRGQAFDGYVPLSNPRFVEVLKRLR